MKNKSNFRHDDCLSADHPYTIAYDAGLSQPIYRSLLILELQQQLGRGLLSARRPPVAQGPQNKAQGRGAVTVPCTSVRSMLQHV